MNYEHSEELVHKGADTYMALLNYRDTVGVTGFSPAQVLMGRRLRTRVSKEEQRMLPSEVVHQDVGVSDALEKKKQAADFSRRHHTRDLPPLQAGTRVWVQLERVAATVLSPCCRPVFHGRKRTKCYPSAQPVQFGPFPT